MGYPSRLTGEWKIDPPLNGKELRELPSFVWIRVRVEEDEKDMDDGSIVLHRRGVAIEPAVEDRMTMYDLHDELIAFAATVQPRTLKGYFVRSGAQQGDVERYWHVAGGTVLSEHAQLRWPDGDIAE